jgi:hypothetical protein
VLAVITDRAATPEPGFAVDAQSDSSIQLRTVRTSGGVNRIKILFSKHVDVQQNDLTVVGGAGSGPTISSTGFSYNGGEFGPWDATWSFDAIIMDRIILTLDGSSETAVTDGANKLDGEWNNPDDEGDNSGNSEFPSGNGTAGGDFVFRITVLRSDLNRDGAVDGLDIDWLVYGFGFPGPHVFEHGDINGDGGVDGEDIDPFFEDFAATPPPGWSGGGGGGQMMFGGGFGPMAATGESDVYDLLRTAIRRRLDTDSSLSQATIDLLEDLLEELTGKA